MNRFSIQKQAFALIEVKNQRHSLGKGQDSEDMILLSPGQKAKQSAASAPLLPTWVRNIFGLRLLAVMAALCVIRPILIILSFILQPKPAIWRHILDTLLLDLFQNTFLLCIGVLSGILVLGVGSAWLTAVYEFQGRSFLNWALILPLALPTNVLSFVFIGLFDFTGPVQTLLRNTWPSAATLFPNIRSAGGVILVLSLALYPYVYLLTRNAFQSQGQTLLEISRCLGKSPLKAFFKAALPMARPWIADGAMLVLMETLADFGAVSIFNYDTFTTAIYKAWFGFFSLPAAAQLASLLLAFVFLILLLEQQLRNKMRFHRLGQASRSAARIRLHGWRKWSVCCMLSAIVLTAFFIPCLQLLIWSLKSIALELDSRYFGLVFRSLFFSVMAAGCVTTLGLLLASIQRRHPDNLTKGTIRLSTMGYALPGTVLAVGVVILVNLCEKPLVWTANEVFGLHLASVLNGSIFAVLFAYTVRSLALGYNSIHSSMLRITQNLDEAAILLGVSGFKQLRKVHIPILKNGLYITAMLVFVDVMKEMPITLMTRPFGWDTLAVKIYGLTSEGEWQRAALPSLVLIFTGFLPLIVLNRKNERSPL